MSSVVGRADLHHGRGNLVPDRRLSAIPGTDAGTATTSDPAARPTGVTIADRDDGADVTFGPGRTITGTTPGGNPPERTRRGETGRYDSTINRPAPGSRGGRDVSFGDGTTTFRRAGSDRAGTWTIQS